MPDALLPGLFVISLLGFLAALVLGRSARHWPATDTGPEFVEAIMQRLPQTQCGYCGHAGCLPYARAIAAGEPINRCPPGGARTIAALAELLNLPALPLDPAHGVEKPRAVAYIREAECIGCVKCIAACPVDAILGAAGQMHTVIAAQCTGCDLCVEPCPVDCIEMREAPPGAGVLPEQARRRFEQREQRLARDAQRAAEQRAARQASAARARVEARQAKVEAAVERVRAQRLGAQRSDPPVAAAVERARQRALERAARMSTETRPEPARPSPGTLARRVAVTERKLERAREKHAQAIAAGDDATRELLANAIARLEERLAKAREQLYGAGP